MRSFGETPGKREDLLNKLVKISETPVKREETPEKGEEPDTEKSPGKTGVLREKLVKREETPDKAVESPERLVEPFYFYSGFPEADMVFQKQIFRE